MYWTVVAIEVAIASVMTLWLVRKSSDPYGLFHLSLNEGSDTEWLNMGYWRECNTFPEACRGAYAHIRVNSLLISLFSALATKVIQAIDYPTKEGMRILDVGHGTGDSLLLLLEHYKPKQLVGITSLAEHSTRSAARMKNTGAVKLFTGDAVCREQQVDHPLKTGKYDVVYALDCIYHFRTRRLFLQQVFDALNEGGRVGFTDIAFTPGFPTISLASLLSLSAPRENVVSDVRTELEEIGYVDVRVEDITEDVFPGFSKFLKPRGLAWWMFAWVMGNVKDTRYLVISATKKM